MHTEHGLTSAEVVIVKAAIADHTSRDGDDYKDSSVSVEGAIIEALGYAPCRMPEAGAAPRAFGRWLSAVKAA